MFTRIPSPSPSPIREEATREEATRKVKPTLPNDFTTLMKALRRLGDLDQLRCCYEAGPTGYVLYRQLKAAGVPCVVIAPSLVPVQTGRRIKTDRRDAAKLAGYLRSGDLTPIHVPDEAIEAIRDLERARDDAQRAERVTRHHRSKFLLRHGRIDTGKTNWGQAHLAWIARQTFDQRASMQVLSDDREAVECATARLERLTARLGELAATWDRAPLVKALQALRGVEMISSVTLVAEICDFRRCATASDLMAYVGLVPSEHSSGSSRRLGGITKTGVIGVSSFFAGLLVSVLFSTKKELTPITLRKPSPGTGPTRGGVRRGVSFFFNDPKYG